MRGVMVLLVCFDIFLEMGSTRFVLAFVCIIPQQ